MNISSTQPYVLVLDYNEDDKENYYLYNSKVFIKNQAIIVA
jgi:hypothetical protein